MKKQDYKHHIFYYWPHHFIYYGAVIAAYVLCAIGIWYYADQRWLWAMMMALITLVVSLALMTRQHYALGNQDRTVRLELRLRYYILTGKRLEEAEQKLSFGQLAALRFASDEEMVVLIDAAIKEDLPADEIKKRIRNWLPDTMRV